MRAILFLAAVLLAVPSLTAANDWPQAGFDQTHQASLSSSENSELVPFVGTWWNNLSIPGPVSSPTVREDIVYFGDGQGTVWAIDRESGGKIWSNTTGSTRISGTAVGQDFVYVVGEGGQLHSFNRKTGRLEDHYPISVGATFGSLMLHEDILYVGSTDGTVKAYFPSTRQQRWTFSTTGLFFGNETTGVDCRAPGSVDGTPVLFDDWIMFGSTNKCFFAVKKSAFGTITPPQPPNYDPTDLVWVFKAEDSIRTTPAVDRTTGQVIFGDVSGNIYAIGVTSSGKAFPTWTYEEPKIEGKSSEFKASPVIVGDKVIVAARNGNVRALSASDGTPLWVTNVGGEVVGTPAAANGRVLVGSFEPKMYMLNVSDGHVQAKYVTLAEVTTWTAISGTQAFWGDRLGNLYSWGGHKPSRADLSVTTLAGSLVATIPGVIAFTVSNVGVLSATNTTATLEVGGKKIAELDVPSLAPGKSFSGSYPYTPSAAGPLKIKFFADATRQVKESDEANNEKTLDATVSDAPAQLPTTTTGGSGPGFEGFLVAAAAIGAILLARRRQH